jgi:hypothetical protein
MFPKGFADFAQKAASAATTAASTAAARVKAEVKTVSKHTSDAYRHASAAAAQSLSSNPAMALVGSELRLGGKHLTVDSLLAEGGFAVVYLCSVVGTEGAEKYVLKKMFAGGAENIAQLTGEVALTEALAAHPNVVKVVGSETRQVGREGVEILVLMEYCSGASGAAGLGRAGRRAFSGGARDAAHRCVASCRPSHHIARTSLLSLPHTAGGHLLSRLNKQMETGRPLPPAKVVDVFLSVVKPVAYMHSRVRAEARVCVRAAVTPPQRHGSARRRRRATSGMPVHHTVVFGSPSHPSHYRADAAHGAPRP